MLRIRVIPLLLLKNRGLVKTCKFKEPRYIGDPVNAVRIFNEKEVDELIFLDIEASFEKRDPDYKLIEEIASEAFMPFAYGGGIHSLDQAKRLFALGVEKIVVNTAAFSCPDLISQLAKYAGTQSIIVAIDVKRNFFGEYEVWLKNGIKKTKYKAVEWAKKAEKLGAGEILLNDIDRDGTMQGYDLKLVKEISKELSVPFDIAGGAGQLHDLLDAARMGASAVVAGSFFVFHGKLKAVLINYPSYSQLEVLFEEVGNR